MRFKPSIRTLTKRQPFRTRLSLILP